MGKEKELAQEFLDKNKGNEILIKIITHVSEMKNELHSDRWSYVYDTIFAHFKRGEVSGAIVTGLTELIEEKGKKLLN